MKTKLTTQLLTLAVMFTVDTTTRADLVQGGAVQPIDAAILQLMTDGYVGLPASNARLDGGADDDQIVGGDGADFVRGDIAGFSFGASNPTSFSTGPVNSSNVAAPGQGIASMTSDGGGWTLAIAGGLGNDTLVHPSGGEANLNNEVARISAMPPTNQGLAFGALNICGGNGNDSVFGGAGACGLNNEVARISAMPPTNQGLASGALNICGGNGNDSVFGGAGACGLNNEVARFAGAADLRGELNAEFAQARITGDGGPDSIVAGPGAGGAPGITGDAGDDLHTDSMILQMMTTGSLHGDDDSDTLWGTTSYGFVFGTTTR
ncbi:MAG: hypothetical protein K1X78_22475 [Verrucomicrobiaceae bacterium]|nr:hypothetical protein [Verrucomicrobiaceae bacterium]